MIAKVKEHIQSIDSTSSITPLIATRKLLKRGLTLNSSRESGMSRAVSAEGISHIKRLMRRRGTISTATGILADSINESNLIEE